MRGINSFSFRDSYFAFIFVTCFGDGGEYFPLQIPPLVENVTVISPDLCIDGRYGVVLGYNFCPAGISPYTVVDRPSFAGTSDEDPGTLDGLFHSFELFPGLWLDDHAPLCRPFVPAVNAGVVKWRVSLPFTIRPDHGPRLNPTEISPAYSL